MLILIRLLEFSFVERNAAAEVADEVREQVAEVSAKIQAVYAELVEPFKRQLDEALAR